MEAPEKIVAEIGQVCSVKRSDCLGGPLFTLEIFYEPYWYECHKWDDSGYVADILIKYGIAADHQSAFEKLKA